MGAMDKTWQFCVEGNLVAPGNPGHLSLSCQDDESRDERKTWQRKKGDIPRKLSCTEQPPDTI